MELSAGIRASEMHLHAYDKSSKFESQPLLFNTVPKERVHVVQIIAVHADDPEFKGFEDIAQLPKHRLAEIRRYRTTSCSFVNLCIA